MSVTRPVVGLVTALFVSLALAGPAWAATVAPGSARGGDVVKVGWWWAANEPPAETGLVAPPQPASPTVPKGSFAVGAVAGDPDKVSAIEFSLAAQPGAYVESFELVLRESDDPGASANQETAKLVACPVTESFWVDGSAAAWKAKPEFDCDLGQAPGVRDAKGLWRFDLTVLALTWLTEGSTSSTSVVLVEDGDAPESFQVAFDGPAEKGIGLRVVTSAAPPVGGGADLPGTTTGSGSSGALPPSGGAPALGGDVTSSGGSSLSSPALGPAPAVADPAGPPQTGTAVAAPPAEQTVPVAATMTTPPWYSGIPTPALLLLPLLLGLAYLMMLALGPDAQPATASTRHGVSRALDRLRAGAQLATRAVR